MLEKLLDSMMSVGTAACLGYLVGIPAIAAVGATALGGAIGALALLTNPSCILFSMLVGAVNFTGFFTPNCPVEWIWVKKR